MLEDRRLMIIFSIDDQQNKIEACPSSSQNFAQNQEDNS